MTREEKLQHIHDYIRSFFGESTHAQHLMQVWTAQNDSRIDDMFEHIQESRRLHKKLMEKDAEFWEWVKTLKPITEKDLQDMFS